MIERLEPITVEQRRARIGMEPIRPAYRDPQERIGDFFECSLGFTREEVMAEASRCIHCPQPAACVTACPMGNDIPLALWFVEKGEFSKAAEIYRQTNPLPEICGRVCPAESTCATSCVLERRDRPIATGPIEAFVADYQRTVDGVPLTPTAPPSGKRVAIIGAGPAGLAAAEDLTVAGHEVTVYEALPAPGGLLVYGIPNFKLDKSLVTWKISWLEQLGVTFVTNFRVGEEVSLDELKEREGFDAVFVGTGAGVEATMDIPGEDLGHVYRSIDFLIRGNVSHDLLPASKRVPAIPGRRVAVIGGGDTATDCLRTSLRLGADEVTCYYRRTEAEMPGNSDERLHAEEEGARFEYLVAPVEFLDRTGSGEVDGMRLIRMELGEPDSSGRRRPIPIEGSEYVVDIDDVILAIGFWPDPLIGKTTPGLETHKWGLIKTDPETGQTNVSGIFAGGDNVTGPALVNAAIAAGKRSAAAIDAYLSSD